MKFWTRIDWLNMLAFAALVMLFFWRILTPNLADRQSFPPGDFQAQFWAFTTFEVRELSQGRLPLWNPYTFAGAPFWADVQAAVFYPPSLLTLLLSALWGFSLFALEVEAIVHYWLAAVFMYLFIRELTQSRPAAVIAALTFTFSGYLTGYPSQQLAVLEAGVWLPLILFFIYRAFLPPAPRPYPPAPLLLLAGIAWGMTLLAGHPQTALIMAYLSSAYFVFLWLTRFPSKVKPGQEKKAPVRYSGWLGLLLEKNGAAGPATTILRSVLYFVRLLSFLGIFLISGLALAAIQFIPAVEYTLLSVRAEGAYDRMAGGFPIVDIIQVLLPGQISFYSPLYVGLAGLLLALWVVFAAPGRQTTFWAAAGLVTLLISFGGNTFLYSPLYLLTPGFSIFRGQERWALATAFSLSVLAGYGFQQLLVIKEQLIKEQSTAQTSAEKRLNSLLRLAGYLFLFALLLAFLFFYGLNDTGWSAASPFYDLLGAATLLAILLALAWLIWRFAAQLQPAVLTVLTGGLICFDLFSVNWQTNLYPQLPEWHSQRPAAVEAIKQDAARFPDAPYRVYNEFRLYDNYGVPFEIEDLWGASPLRPDRYDRFLAPPMPIERVWELLNVKYVITWRETLYVPSTVIHQEPAADGVTYVHRLESAGPRAWFVTEAEIAGDAQMLEKIADPNFDRWNTALLEPEARPYVAGLDQAALEQVKSDDIQISRLAHHPSHLAYQISTPTAGLLILSEPYYPGWQATLDGDPAPLLRANYILRAIPIPAGDHTLQLRFQPLSFTVGAAVSGLAIVVIAFSLGRSYLKHRLAGSALALKKPQRVIEAGAEEPQTGMMYRES